MELPCIIESQKTLDYINYLKSNDISQMIYVHPNNEDHFEKGIPLMDEESWLISMLSEKI